MKIEKIIVGPLQTNCYLLEKNNKLIIIDPGDEFLKIKKAVGNRKVVAIFVTHQHADHIGALKEVQEYYQIDYINPKKVNDFVYKVIPTPGHKEDSITFYFQEEHCMFCGDFIFYHSIGRMDLPGGDQIEMKKSLEVMQTYPKETILYPGHGPKTILGEEIPSFSYYIKTF